MMFRNSFRLLFANFSLFWKELLYKIIVLAVCVLLVLPIFSQILNLAAISGLWVTLKDLLLNIPVSSVKEYFGLIWAFVQNVINCIAELFSKNIFAGIYLFLIAFIVKPFLISLSDLAVGEVLYCSMSSLSKVSYTGMFVRKIGKSCLYSLCKLCLFLPVACALFSSFYGFLLLAMKSEIWMIFAPMLIVLSLALIFGMYQSFTCGFMPAIVVYNCGIKNAFAKGLKAVGRRFFRILSTVCAMFIFFTAIVVLFGLLSLIAVLPLAYMTLLIFRMVMFFGSQGMNYYVDLDTILKPKKLEETDKLNKTINII